MKKIILFLFTGILGFNITCFSQKKINLFLPSPCWNVGLQENEINKTYGGFLIKPNPNDGNFSVYLENEPEINRFYRIRITDVMGRVLYRKEIKPDGRYLEFKDLRLVPGTYYLILQDDQYFFAKMLIIQ